MYIGRMGMTDFLMPISIMSLNSLNPLAIISDLRDAPHMPIKNASTRAVVTEHRGLISKENHGVIDAFSTALRGSVSVISDGNMAEPQV